MTPSWKTVPCGDPSVLRRRVGQHLPFLQTNSSPSRWNGRDRFWDSFAPAGSCRPVGKPPYKPCRSDEPYHPAPGRFAFHTTHAENSPLRPRIVTVVRACGGAPENEPGGGKPRKITILLNRRAVQTFEQLVADISEALGFPQWRNNRVRRLFSLRGREIRSVSDFFHNDDLYVAAGRERPSPQEVQQVLEELFPDSAGFHGTVLQDWERLLRPLAKASKADSGFHEEPEPFQSKAPGHSSTRVKNRVFQNRKEERHKREQMRAEGWGAKSWAKNTKGGFPLKDVVERPDGVQAPCPGMGPRRQPLAPIRVLDVPPAVDVQEEVTDRIQESLEARVEGAGKGPAGNSCPSQKVLGEPESRGATSCSPEGVGTESGGNVEDGTGFPKVPDSPAAETGKETQNGTERAHMNGSPARESNSEPRDSTEHPLIEARGMVDCETEFPDPLPAGMVLSQSDIEHCYEMGRILGDGNFAVVKECWRRGAGTRPPPLAMKIIDRTKLHGKEHMAHNEICIIQNLRHPNVVQFLRHYETVEHIYLLMELVAGGDLFEAITETVRFPEEYAACLLQDVCEALAYIHRKCIVHRDVKPENLLVQHNADGSSTLKLADFGLAMVVTEPIFIVCGTPTYVAPEILAEKGYGLPVDMWAVGVIAYILLCGFAPFRSQEKDQEQLFQLIQQGEYEFLLPYWDGISQGAKDFTRQLLVVEPQMRMTAREALQHCWLQGKGHLDHPES